jgi:hypothetical protein
MLNRLMSGVYDKDPRKARSRALALEWLASVFEAQSSDVHRK